MGEMGTDHGFSNYPKTWSVPFFLPFSELFQSGGQGYIIYLLSVIVVLAMALNILGEGLFK